MRSPGLNPRILPEMFRHRQSLVIARSEGEAEDQAFIDSVSDLSEA